MKNNFYRSMLLCTLVILGLAACANQPTASAPDPTPAVAPSNDVIAEGRLRPIRAANLSFQQPAIVEEVHVQIGDPVSEGDPLARLASADQAEAQLAAARLALVEAQQALDTLTRTGASNLASTWTAYMDAQEVRAEAEREWEDLNVEDIEERIDDARAEVQDRAADLQEAQEEFDRYSDLDEGNASRQSAEDELETAQEDHNEALRNLEEITRERDTVRAALDAALAAESEARHQYELSSEGANGDQLVLARTRLENAEAQVAAAEDLLSNYVLSAPFDGVVLDVSVEAGEQVAAGARAVSVADTSSWIVETTDVTELEVVDLAVGQPVTFTADALPAVTMSGTVSEISQSSLVQGGDVIYTVRIQAEEVDPRVLWGMTVEVIFESRANN
ncbi:MAG TPA: HlyD family efflux transporter periplasmic adaptor subunit [Anaerolineales bacterium]|nr:HlyD family efflux transporter periplasmic adaptor subunit [Anaerolineales bacterium]